MILDLNDGTTTDDDYDLCILGAGPAGISIAQKFLGTGIKVLLLEAGGLTYTAESQQLLECDSTGIEAWPQLTRQRFFGGTSNHWAGRCRPFEAYDFVEKKFGNLPGWPIRYEAIEPFLSEAMGILDIDEKKFQSVNIESLGLDFVPDRSAHSPPTRFGQKYYQSINMSENITCYLNANATQTVLDEKGEEVVSVIARNYSNQSFRFRASFFIVAMGGIENARFLLNQDKQIKGGIGNQSGMVGKCFMEHINAKLGEFILSEPTDTEEFQFYTTRNFASNNHVGSGNAHMHLLSKVRSFGRTAKVKTFFKILACDLGIEEKIKFISDFECPGTGIVSTLIEQIPNTRSKVTIGSQIDAVGLRQATLNWELDEYDIHTIREIARGLAKAFADAGLGLVRLESYILDESLDIPVARHAHHMGTTRMAEKSEFGVVDSDCKVFGTQNLYIAGSSIFSTGGACNPTMPLIQFALRLANHLQQKLQDT